MRIGLKLWSTNFKDYALQAQSLYAQGIFDFIELYIVPGTLQALPAWKSIAIPYTIHAPHFMHGFNLAQKEKASFNAQIYAEVKNFADNLEASHIIFHGGIDGSIEETARQLTSFQEPRALLENKPYRALPNRMGGSLCRGYNLAEIKLVMQTSSCGFCLDFGHAVCAANSLQQEPYAYIENLLTLGPAYFHLTDVEDMGSEYDAHPHLGQGNLDLQKIISYTPRQAMLTVETVKSFKEKLDDFVEDVVTVKKLIANKTQNKSLEYVPISLRLVTAQDKDFIFNIANDPHVRQASFQSKPISLGEHDFWFKKRLLSKDPFYIAAYNNNACGYVRFESLGEGSLLISIALSEEVRGRGLGAQILSKACKVCLEATGCKHIVARIKEANLSSINVFRKACFTALPETSQNGVVEMVYPSYSKCELE